MFDSLSLSMWKNADGDGAAYGNESGCGVSYGEKSVAEVAPLFKRISMIK